jgi:hypothetical protein
MTSPSALSANSRNTGAKTPGSVVIMLAAVSFVGTYAAFTVSPLLIATTFIVVFLIARSARTAPKSGIVSPQFPELPPSLRATVDRTIEQLPEGDARRLLFNAIVQARPLLAPHAAALDEQQERATRDNVCSLVEACCTTALEMARLDLASSAGDQASGSDEAQHLAAARDLLAGRLSHAASALSSLYVAGVEHGSPASDRVAELVGEINADASARRAAATEMGALLRDREAT